MVRLLTGLLMSVVVSGCATKGPAVEAAQPGVEPAAERSTGFVGFEQLETSLRIKEPVVVVFFATWCELCAHKVKTVRRATDEVGGAKVVFVAVDGDDTKHHIPGFLREHRMADAPVIDGLAHPAEVERYNPWASIPLVLVVDKQGQLVETQIGLRSGDGQRLEDSLRVARLDQDARR